MLRQTSARVLLSKNNCDYETSIDAMKKYEFILRGLNILIVGKTLAMLIDSVGHFV